MAAKKTIAFQCSEEEYKFWHDLKNEAGFTNFRHLFNQLWNDKHQQGDAISFDCSPEEKEYWENILEVHQFTDFKQLFDYWLEQHQKQGYYLKEDNE